MKTVIVRVTLYTYPLKELANPMKEHFLLVLEHGTVHVLRPILLLWVILLLFVSKTIQ